MIFNIEQAITANNGVVTKQITARFQKASSVYSNPKAKPRLRKKGWVIRNNISDWMHCGMQVMQEQIDLIVSGEVLENPAVYLSGLHKRVVREAAKLGVPLKSAHSQNSVVRFHGNQIWTIMNTAHQKQAAIELMANLQG